MIYIDADKLKDIKFNSISNDKYGIYRMGWNDAIDAVVDNEPTADVVEVVRCKDCKYRHKEWHHDKRNKNGGYWISWCANDAIAERVYGLAFDYDYCSYGEETRHEV